ncbi:ArsR/SmtB family transcription factor [Oenococcus sicerae]|uniref:Transcriptional regulator n=1 Tax=Oenococcus sicerae TaxID=2203724 RepID=A0AAJ1RCS2_9LACO|nr:helix-turn-helix transcriptional regulator [Oenococcus sicerae]MDN6900585.1 transcriptional regulator [Oenococcus sicerae]
MPDININKIDLTQLLKSLSDPIRLEIIAVLFMANKECSCAIFNDLGKKSNLSQHYRNLRLNALISIRRAGLHSYLTLRRKELDERFPGLLATIVDNWKNQRH